MITEEEDYFYVIPHNYQENGKILGFIEKQSFIIGIAWAIFWLFVMYFFPFIPIMYKFIIYVIIGVFPAAIAFVGIGHDTVVDYVKYYLDFQKKAKVYKFEK